MVVQIDNIDPLFLAHSKFKRRKYDECNEICTALLAENPYDKAVWFLKCKVLTAQEYIDDTELEEQGIGDILLDDNATASLPRPGTSLNRVNGELKTDPTTPSQSVRPLTSSGAQLTGFQRPGTKSSKDGAVSIEDAYKGNRPGTSRPVTTLGRQVRLGTASMMTQANGPFIDVTRLNLKKYASRPSIGKALCDYLIYHEHNPTKALELASEATAYCNFDDWWWKSRLGKCYYQLNLMRDAEKQFKSAIRQQPHISLFLELGKVYMRMDQPNTALDNYKKALEHFPSEIQILLAVARAYDAMQDTKQSNLYYKQALSIDPSCVEAIAMLASFAFYTDQPEVALRYYRRLVQMGIDNAELWNNLGLCCFYASQYDMTLSCFEKAISMAEDSQMADIWYNIGEFAIAMADLGLAYQAFNVAVSINPSHASAHNNLGVLELRKGNLKAASSCFDAARQNGPHMYEPYYNSGLLNFKKGEIAQSYQFAEISHDLYPQNKDTTMLMDTLVGHLTGR